MNYNITVAVPDEMVSSLSKYYGYSSTVLNENNEEVANPQTAVQFIAERVVMNLVNQAKEAILSSQVVTIKDQIEAVFEANPIQVEITEVA